MRWFEKPLISEYQRPLLEMLAHLKSQLWAGSRLFGSHSFTQQLLSYGVFLGPREPLRVPSMTVHPSTRPPVHPRQKSRSPLQPNKSSQGHCQSIKPYIFRKLMTHTILRPPGMTMTKTNTHTKTNTKTKTQEIPMFQC